LINMSIIIHIVSFVVYAFLITTTISSIFGLAVAFVLNSSK